MVIFISISREISIRLSTYEITQVLKASGDCRVPYAQFDKSLNSGAESRGFTNDSYESLRDPTRELKHATLSDGTF